MQMPKMGLKNIFSFKPSSPMPPSSPPNNTFSDTLVEENIETARSLITKWDPTSTSNQSSYPKTAPLFTNTRQEANQYLHAVMTLLSTMQYLVPRDSSSQKLVQAQSLIQLAIKRLENEFYRILAENRDHFDPESVSTRSSTGPRSSVSDYDDDFSEDEFAGNSVSTVAISDLKAIAECMVSAGYSKECVKIYILMRKSIVDEALYDLGVERLSLSQVQKMDWKVLELKIKYWLNAVKVSVGTLFHGERALCDYVFGSPDRKIAESCFAEICREGAASLFKFPENVAKCKKTPEKLFRTLDLYEAISDNWQQIESVFSFESTSSIRSQAVASQVRLGEAVRTMLFDFESAIQKESSKIPVPGGGIHPLTRYVMNYVAFLADYSDAVGDIVTDWPQNPLPESYYRSPNREENNPSSEIAERFAWLILVLLCKLDGKAELYNDIALSYLFLANNMQYVVVKVRKSNLGFLLGEDWLTNHESKVKEYVSKYERVGWSKVLPLLPENPTAEMPAEQARAIFQSFNVAFHEACKAQSSWIVSDPKHREEIKASIASKLVPRYREFYDMHGVGSNIGLLPDDLGNYLSEILYGMGQSQLSNVSLHSTSPPHRFKRP